MITIYDSINTAVFVLLAFMFAGIFLKFKQTNRRALFVVLWITAELIVNLIFQNIFILRAVFTVAVTCIFSLLIFRSSYVKIIVVSIVQYLLGVAFDFLAYMIAIRFTGYIHLFEVNESINMVYGGVISQLIYLMTIIALTFLFKKNDYKDIGTLEIFKFSIFPIISISLIVSFAYFSSGRELTDNEITFYTCLALCFILLNLYMFWLLKVDVDNKITITRQNLTNEYASELSSLYRQITDEHKEIAGIEHEYKNTLSVIASLSSSGEYDKLNDYLKSNKLSSTYTDIVDTGNTIASAIINAKYSEATRKGIQVRIDINNLSNIGLSDNDLVIVLSNLFNNAIEACEKLSGEKIISIKISNVNDLLFISFSNTSGSDSLSMDTSKPNKFLHGHGLQNIKRIIESYDGHVEISNENGLFSVRIIILSSI